MKKFVTAIIRNFGPWIGFYIINHIWGFRIGVITSIVLTFGEFIFFKIKKQQISSFFYFSSALVVLFGMLDLFMVEPFFIKFEASLTNLCLAIFFGISLFKEKPIIQEFAESQKRTSMEQSLDKTYFFKVFTLAWCCYFLIKSIFYLLLPAKTTLNEILILRFFIGKISFWLMMFISIGMPRQIWKAMAAFRLFPSQRQGQ